MQPCRPARGSGDPADLRAPRLPATRLREVNRIFETTALGSYRTEFYPTYDYKAVGIANHDKTQAKWSSRIVKRKKPDGVSRRA